MIFMKKHLKLKITPYNSGKLAEFLCRLYMRLHGYKIIAKNYRAGNGQKTPYGELDFIALKNKRIVFCEVKKRKNEINFEKALSIKQQQRIINGGLNFIRLNKQYHSYSMQFDVFFVKLPFDIKRIENAILLDKLH